MPRRLVNSVLRTNDAGIEVGDFPAVFKVYYSLKLIVHIGCFVVVERSVRQGAGENKI